MLPYSFSISSFLGFIFLRGGGGGGEQYIYDLWGEQGGESWGKLTKPCYALLR